MLCFSIHEVFKQMNTPHTPGWSQGDSIKDLPQLFLKPEGRPINIFARYMECCTIDLFWDFIAIIFYLFTVINALNMN